MVNVMTLSQYTEMWNRIIAWQKKNNTTSLPAYVTVSDMNVGVDKIYKSTYMDMYNRVKVYNISNGSMPSKIGIEGSSASSVTYATSYLKSFASAAGGNFTTIKEAYNLLIGLGYKYYYNDVYDQTTALTRLKTRSGLNCSDICQLMYQVAKDMGYNVRYVHIRCSSGGGHIQLDVSGKELGSTWIRIDPAAALSVGTKASWGTLWCNNGTVLSYNDTWLLSDDGV